MSSLDLKSPDIEADKNEMRDFVCTTPIGGVEVKYRYDRVIGVDFRYDDYHEKEATDETGIRIAKIIRAFFSRGRTLADLNIELDGTDHQKRVWAVLKKIPLGQVRTYADVAKEISSSPRAVGNACRANPVPLLVPCHRVVAKNGLGGFAGQTSGRKLDIKEWLLKHEGRFGDRRADFS